ncbi:hypothetical protein QVN91_04185 [Bacteroides caecigallinarum]|nr:hypothetical protein [Bacteroides caecigallinarum]
MGNFEETRKAKEEVRKKNDVRKEKIAGYFFDLSKLSFAGMVIGGITPLFTNTDNEVNYFTSLIGLVSTYIFAFTANRILK